MEGWGSRRWACWSVSGHQSSNWAVGPQVSCLPTNPSSLICLHNGLLNMTVFEGKFLWLKNMDKRIRKYWRVISGGFIFLRPLVVFSYFCFLHLPNFQQWKSITCVIKTHTNLYQNKRINYAYFSSRPPAKKSAENRLSEGIVAFWMWVAVFKHKAQLFCL